MLAFNALSTGVVLFSDAVVKAAPNEKGTVRTMLQGDVDDIELKALAVLLESQGFEVFNLGASAPAESVAQLVKSKRPHFVFLLSSEVANEDALVEGHRRIHFGMAFCGASFHTQLHEFYIPVGNGTFERLCRQLENRGDGALGPR